MIGLHYILALYHTKDSLVKNTRNNFVETDEFGWGIPDQLTKRILRVRCQTLPHVILAYNYEI